TVTKRFARATWWPWPEPANPSRLPRAFSGKAETIRQYSIEERPVTDPMIPIRRKAQRLSAKSAAGIVRAHYLYWDSQYRPYLIEAVRRLPLEHFDYKP